MWARRVINMGARHDTLIWFVVLIACWACFTSPSVAAAAKHAAYVRSTAGIGTSS